MFKASDGSFSQTKDIEIVKGLTWFDNENKLRLIDCPGLQDTGGNDQKILDKMADQLS